MATVATASSTIFKGIQEQKQQNYEAGVASNNAVYAQRAEADANARGALEEQARYRQLSALKGKQAAAMSANGVDLSSGSPLDVASDTAVLGNADAQLVRENTAREAQGFAIDSANYTTEAAAHRAAGKGALFGSFLSAGGTILGGVSNASGAAAKYGKPGWMGGKSSAIPSSGSGLPTVAF